MNGDGEKCRTTSSDHGVKQELNSELTDSEPWSPAAAHTSPVPHTTLYVGPSCQVRTQAFSSFLLSLAGMPSSKEWAGCWSGQLHLAEKREPCIPSLTLACIYDPMLTRPLRQGPRSPFPWPAQGHSTGRGFVYCYIPVSASMPGTKDTHSDHSQWNSNASQMPFPPGLGFLFRRVSFPEASLPSIADEECAECSFQPFSITEHSIGVLLE